MTRHVLIPNSWRESVLFGAVGASLVVILVSGLLARWLLPYGTPPLVSIAMVVLVGATFLGVRQVLTGRRLELERQGEEWVLFTGKGPWRRAAEVKVSRGYHPVQARGRRGVAPALAVDFPEGPWLVVGLRDPGSLWWWEEELDNKLQQPTHWLPGPAWAELVRELGCGDTLRSRPLGRDPLGEE